MQKVQRNTNIELLRIICMLFLILHHCTVHGGAVSMENHINKDIAIFFIPAGKIAFIAFIAISTYFLVDQSFRTIKFFKMWFMVLFYSVVFTIVTLLLGESVTPGFIVASFFPIIGNAHGFAATYLAFYLLSPFLHKIAKELTKLQLKYLSAILFIFEIGSQLLGSLSGYYQNLPSELLLFIFCYFISLYLKRYPFKLCKNKTILLLIVICIYMLRYSLSYIHTDSVVLQKALNFLIINIVDESSIFNIVAGYALFYFVLNLKVPSSKLLNSLATASFPVLLIHDHNVFRYTIWNTIYKCQDWYYSAYFVCYLFAVVFSLYIVGYCIEYLRKKVIDANIFKNNKVEKKCAWIDQLIND